MTRLTAFASVKGRPKLTEQEERALASACQVDLQLAQSRLTLEPASLSGNARRLPEWRQRRYVLSYNPPLHLERHVGPEAVGRFMRWYEQYLPYARRRAERWANHNGIDTELLIRDACFGLMRGLVHADQKHSQQTRKYYLAFWINAALRARLEMINDEPLADEGENNPDAFLTEMPSDPEAVDALHKALDSQRYMQAILGIWPQLSPIEQNVVVRRYLLETPESFKQIGDGSHLSRERIRQIEAHAFRKLRRYLTQPPYNLPSFF